jgi:hypothetical protein
VFAKQSRQLGLERDSYNSGTKDSARGAAMQALHTLDEQLAHRQHSAAACTRSFCCAYQSVGTADRD